MSRLTHTTLADFERTVIESDQPVLVDFYADWCGPCRALSPVLEKLGEELAGRARIVKVNVDEQPELASRYRVSSIPTLVLFSGGVPVSQMVGLRSPAEIRRLVESAVPTTG